MPAAYRSHNALFLNNGSTAFTINKPAGVVDGDVLIALVEQDNVSGTVTPPAGWTLLGTSPYTLPGNVIYVYYKVAASEGASWTWTWSTTFDRRGIVIAVSTPDPTTPVANFVAAFDNTTGTTAAVTPTTTPTAAGLDLAIFYNVFGAGVSAASVDNGFTLQYNGAATQGIYVASKTVPAGVAVGDTTFTLDANQGNSSLGMQVIVNDPPAHVLQMIV